MEPVSIETFLNTIADETRRDDSRALVQVMQAATHATPVLWGKIIGFGTNHYQYESGRVGDALAVGFAPRKEALVLYGLGYSNQDSDLVNNLGKYKLGKGCMYIKHLSDVNLDVLAQMVSQAYQIRNNV